MTEKLWNARRLVPICTLFVLLVSVNLPVVGAQTEAPNPDVRLSIYPTALLIRDSETGELLESPIRKLTGENTYLTSVSVAPWDRDRLLVSTTFHGLYESHDGGRTWVDLGEEGLIEPLYRGSGFYEDLAAAAYLNNDPGTFVVELANGGEILVFQRGAEAVQTVGTEPGVEAEAVVPTDTVAEAEPGVQTETVVPTDAVAEAKTALAAAHRVVWPDYPELDKVALERRETASGKESFYLSPWELKPKQLALHLDFAEEYDLNAVVIDFKDDVGRIAYNSQLEFHRSIGAVWDVFDARRVIDTVHDRGLYLIARVVVFKDKELYGYNDNQYAVWDRRLDEAWAVYRDERMVEHWVDPFAEEVWEYNIAIAEELEQLGVDEIQFDYIRTPADGKVWDIEYRHKRDSAAMTAEDPYVDDRVEALSAFLARARERISIPIGIDVFGFNAWYRMSYLGQDIGALARYVDVISPMLYPSHFARDFAEERPYIPRARYIYEDGVRRARRITADHVLIRPYVQAFLIGGELNYEEPEYTRYLKEQVRGAGDGGANGFTLWNFSGRYYMTTQGIR